MTSIHELLNSVDWKPIEDCHPSPPGPGALYATHQGTLTIGDTNFRCYRLCDGQAVLHADDVEEFFRELGE